MLRERGAHESGDANDDRCNPGPSRRDGSERADGYGHARRTATDPGENPLAAKRAVR